MRRLFEIIFILRSNEYAATASDTIRSIIKYTQLSYLVVEDDPILAKIYSKSLYLSVSNSGTFLESALIVQIGLDPSTAKAFVFGASIVAPKRFKSDCCDPNVLAVRALTFRLNLH